MKTFWRLVLCLMIVAQGCRNPGAVVQSAKPTQPQPPAPSSIPFVALTFLPGGVYQVQSSNDLVIWQNEYKLNLDPNLNVKVHAIFIVDPQSPVKFFRSDAAR